MHPYRQKIDPMINLSKKAPDVHALLTMSLTNKRFALTNNKCVPFIPFIPAPPVRVETTNKSKNLVSVMLRNGLGNRIFQILAALGYAEKHKKVCVISRDLVSTGMKTHEQNLEGIIIKIFSNLPIVDSIEHYTGVREEREMNYSSLPTYNSNIVLQGYFQDEKYFPSNAYIPEIRNAHYKNTFFIHIRAGDYLDPGSFGLDLVEYHKNCLADIKTTMVSDIKYLVFSNDNRYANNYMKQFGIQYTISDKSNSLDALIEMANCAGGICANSTFSWLGGFFQGGLRGKIYMPSVWLKGRDCRGIYPKWATVIDIAPKKIWPIPSASPADIPDDEHSTAITTFVDSANPSVCVVLSGGLGNVLFQIFAGLAYSRKYNKRYVICKSMNQEAVKDHEKNLDTMILNIFPNLEYVNSFNSYHEIREIRHMEYDELPNIQGNVLIRGYFQVEHYSLYIPEIRNIRTDYYEDTYFIHIRLGDYIGFCGMDFDLSNYHRRCFNILGPNAKYIVFSNENDKADIYIKRFNVNYRISDKVNALEALVEMANCAGGICANSTFSWMGAFFQRQPRQNIFVPDKWMTRPVIGIYPSWARRIEV